MDDKGQTGDKAAAWGVGWPMALLPTSCGMDQGATFQIDKPAKLRVDECTFRVAISCLCPRRDFLRGIRVHHAATAGHVRAGCLQTPVTGFRFPLQTGLTSPNSRYRRTAEPLTFVGFRQFADPLENRFGTCDGLARTFSTALSPDESLPSQPPTSWPTRPRHFC